MINFSIGNTVMVVLWISSNGLGIHLTTVRCVTMYRLHGRSLVALTTSGSWAHHNLQRTIHRRDNIHTHWHNYGEQRQALPPQQPCGKEDLQHGHLHETLRWKLIMNGFQPKCLRWEQNMGPIPWHWLSIIESIGLKNEQMPVKNPVTRSASLLANTHTPLATNGNRGHGNQGYMCVCMYACMYTCMHVRTYVCMHVIWSNVCMVM